MAIALTSLRACLSGRRSAVVVCRRVCMGGQEIRRERVINILRVSYLLGRVDA